MTQSQNGSFGRLPATAWLGITALVLLLVVGGLFIAGLLPGRTVFSNDGPLGAIMAASTDLPSGFKGFWQDLNWLGFAGTSATPTLTQLLGLTLGKVGYSKLFAPVSLIFLGLGAWGCFRLWKFSPIACFLGALAAALNTGFFSASAWGVASQPIAIGFTFLALGALADEQSPRRWIRVLLGGFAVGMAVMEASDIGAIFSLLVALFVMFQALNWDTFSVPRVATGVVRVGIVAVSAGILAAAALITLVGTQIQGVAVQEQSREEKWDWATQWSLPKRETLGFVVPGLFGYRMDTPDGGSYWGFVGRSPAWERFYAGQGPRPGGGHRFSGGGQYAGTLVLLLAAFAVAQGFRKQSPTTPRDQRFIRFWLGVAVVALLLSYGRFAPFYQFFYALPFASTIRNPAKFIHVVEFCLIILFAYGVDALSRQYLAAGPASAASLKAQLKNWWSKAVGFERNWVRGLTVFFVVSVLAWLVYTGSKAPLLRYLQEVDFDEASATAIADFSIRQPLWFLLFFVLGAFVILIIQSGFFRGKRAVWAGALLALLLTVDLARANRPWVITYNWRERYASNPVIDFLRKDANQHRVAILPFQPPPQLSLLHDLYRMEWAQHQFLYYNIQSLDVVQMPRPPVDMEAFEKAMHSGGEDAIRRLIRKWELTNTRYLLGPFAYVDFLNQKLDPGRNRFRSALRFEIVGRPGVITPKNFDELTAVAAPEGQYAVIEFTGALPRAALYTDWQVITNGAAALERLVSPDFDPHKQVLVQDPVSGTPSATTNELAGSVDILSYAPKDVRLKASVKQEAVLLYNDRFDPNWRLEVDGQSAPLLRANFLMRGAKLSPGEHSLRFYFVAPMKGLYISLGALAVAVLLIGFLALTSRPPEDDKPPSA